MKKGIELKITELLFVIGIMFCFLCMAAGQEEPIKQESRWVTKHFENGKTRFEVLHGDKTHYYEVKLTGIDIDGDAIELTAPDIQYHKNHVVKQWLTFLKENWVDAQGQIKWTFELDRPTQLLDSSKQITLKFDIDSDGVNGLTIAGGTSVLFDMDVYGNPIHKQSIHSSKENSVVSLGMGGTYCDDAIEFVTPPGNYQSVVFNLEKQTFPLFAQSLFSFRVNSGNKNNSLKSSWFQANFSEHDDLIQLTVPTEKRVNGQITDTIDFFQNQRTKGARSGPKGISRSQLSDFQKLEQGVIDYVKVAGVWYQIIADKKTLKSWQSQPNSNHQNSIKKAVSSIENQAQEFGFGTNFIIQDGYLFVASNGIDNSQINIFKYNKDQWLKQKPIMIPNKSVKKNGIKVDREIVDVVVKGDLMVVALIPIGMTLPLNFEDDQSAGEVRIYRKIRRKWLLEEILDSTEGNSEDAFGEVIAVENNTVLVSAQGFTPVDKNGLYGQVFAFNYQSGQWQKPMVIKPPLHAKNSGYFQHQGFGSQMQIRGDDLYIKALHVGYSSTNPNPTENQDECPYFDSFGVIYHYRKDGQKWQLMGEIKSSGQASNIFGPMLADSTGLYYISSDYNHESGTSEIFIKHYSGGHINWKQSLSKAQ